MIPYGRKTDEDVRDGALFKDNQTSTDEVVFPFLSTPSGNFKVVPDQVVFESKKLSVLVANPKCTKVNITADLGSIYDVDSRGSNSNANVSLHNNNFECVLNEYTEKHEVLHTDEEHDLETLGFRLEAINWNEVPDLDKSDIINLISHRISNQIGSDFIVCIGQEVFNCHLLVLQCYSSYFDSLKETKKVDIPESNVTSAAFNAIYHWMISTGLDSYRLITQDNILEVLAASQFLGVQELEGRCWALLDSDQVFSEEAAFHLYFKAKRMGNTTVTELMLPRIMRFFLTLVSSKDYLELPIEDLCEILSSSYIAVHGEIEVFMSAVRWLMHDWMRRKEYALVVMNCVRFGHIAPWQLVDIRRNPENPEFTELTSNSGIAHLVEDGLAYAIVRHWYGSGSPEYYHWIGVLGLVEPVSRNWIGDEKVLITFKEFLEDLESYRQPRALDNVIPRGKIISGPTGDNPYVTDMKCFNAASFSTLAKFINKDCSERNVEKKPSHQTSMENRSEDSLPSRYCGSKANISCNDDKVRICSGKSETSKMGTVMTANVLYKVSELTNSASQSIQNEMPQISISYQNPHPQNLEEFPCEVMPIDLSIESCKFTPQMGTSRNILTALHEPSTFSAMVKGRIPFQHTRQMSVSVLSPSNKNYLAEGSLFFPEREAVLVFGGVDPHSQYGISRNSGKDIYRYQPDANVWEFVGELPEPRHHHSVAFLKGRVYLVGGADPRDDDVRGKSVVVSTVWSYEPVSRSWLSESGMLTPRKNFGLVVSNGKMFAIGGQDRLGRILSSVERFDPLSGVWEEVAPLGVGRMGVAATKFRELIWVAGGMTGSKKSPLSKVVECYDTRQNVWFPFTSLRFPCCFGRLYTMSDSLYLIGGAGRMTERDHTTSSLGVIDVWDTHAKEWHLQAEMSIPRHGHSVAYLGTQLLIIGGVTTVYMRALSSVECFCCERGTWIRGVSNVPTTLSGHGSITLPPASLM